MHRPKGFWAALSFYTRIPVAIGASVDRPTLAASSVYLPLIGSLVGGLCALAFAVAHQFWPASIAVLLSLVTGVLLTGALHEDGFADACDGFGGGWEREQVLRIMKDSRVGSYGAIGLVLLLGLKYTVLLEIQRHAGAAALGTSLVAAHTLSRLYALWQMRAQHYVRTDEQSKSAAMINPQLSPLQWLGALTVPLAALCLLPPLAALSAVALSALIGVIWSLYCYRRIGGYTGDCLGAMQQMTEVGCYLAVLIAATQ